MRLNFRNPRTIFWLILFLTSLAFILDLPKNKTINFSLGPLRINQVVNSPEINLNLGRFSFHRDLNVQQGLDIKGGTQVTLEAEMAAIPESDRKQALESAKNVVERRVNLYGLAEPNIQTAIQGNSYRILVDLAGVENIDQALDLIGKTAQLDFREYSASAAAAATESAYVLPDVKTGLTGKDLKQATVQFDRTTGKPQVGLEFTNEGTKLFADITKRNVGSVVGIFLDDLPLTLPRVQQTITGGQAVITGSYDIESAKQLVVQLNGGALPVPLRVISQRNIGASLGDNSVKQSLIAGLFGLILVMLFMAFYYGRYGLIADSALIIYALITLAIYKLIPITLTLPGLAGFILSIGMAVDANILIFERIKEERRDGKPYRAATELGFGRAWDSIKDANVATLITSFVLYNPFNWTFLNSSGLVRGFAITLAIGIIVSLFTGIVVTRTFIRVLLPVPKES